MKLGVGASKGTGRIENIQNMLLNIKLTVTFELLNNIEKENKVFMQ